MELSQAGDDGRNLFFWRQYGAPKMPCARNLARHNNNLAIQSVYNYQKDGK